MHGQITIRLNNELEERLTSLAHHLNRKRSEIVRLALERFVKEEASAIEALPFDNVKHLLGAAATGVTDLGESHREHLQSRFRRNA
jgi:predicted transcriptional regulator